MTSEVSIDDTPRLVATRVHGVAGEQAGKGARNPVEVLQALTTPELSLLSSSDLLQPVRIMMNKNSDTQTDRLRDSRLL
jgi:hypothetical protein